jgi:hypothetical protein
MKNGQWAGETNMKRALLAFAIITALFGCATGNSGSAVSAQTTLERRVFELINSEREKASLDPYRWFDAFSTISHARGLRRQKRRVLDGINRQSAGSSSAYSWRKAAIPQCSNGVRIVPLPLCPHRQGRRHALVMGRERYGAVGRRHHNKQAQPRPDYAVKKT